MERVITNKPSTWNGDSFRIILLVVATVVAVYGFPRLGLPAIVNRLLFVLILFRAYSTKDDLFWLTWYFILLDAPGRLFSAGSGAEVFRLPIYSVGPGISATFQELFLIVYLIKELRWRTKTRFIFKNHSWLLLLIASVYIGISFILGISFQNLISTIRMILPWSWLLLLPRYIKTKDDLSRVYYMLAPMVILAFVTMIQSYITNNFLHDLLAGTGRTYLTFEASEYALSRISSAGFVTFFCIMLSLYYLTEIKNNINRNYLILITALGSIATVVSGTRGWIIGLFIMYLSSLFLTGFGMFRQVIRFVAVFGILAVILVNVFPVLASQSVLAFERVETLGALAQGDLTAEGTLSRLTVRGPRVMAAFRESPVIGWGFSDKFWQHADMHVGNQTNLLNLGIAGFIPFNLLFFSICFITFRQGRKLHLLYNKGNSYVVFLFALFALFAIHSSSTMLWAYVTSAQLFWALIFSSINVELSA